MWRQTKAASTYVVVCVTSDCTERFLNMCRHKGIIFWDISKKENGFEGKVSRKDFLQLKDICYKTRSRVRILSRRGVRFLLFQYRRHYSFLAGICISCMLLYGCSLFAWDVSFTGNSTYTDSLLIKYLSSLGIHAGIPIKQIDCNLIERSLRTEYDDITWVSAEIRGTRLIIHIKENDGAKETEQDFDSVRDIVATADGTVQSIITRRGTPKVKPGDTVEKGQILVSGIVEIKDDAGEAAGKIYTEADADISIQTTLSYTDRLDIAHEVKHYTGREKKKAILGICGKNMEIGFSLDRYKNADVVTEMSVLKLTNSFYLPIKTGNKVYLEYKTDIEEYTQEEAEQLLNERLNRYLKELLQNKVQILDNSVKINSNSVCYTMGGTLTVYMPAYEYAAIVDTDPVNDENVKESSE